MGLFRNLVQYVFPTIGDVLGRLTALANSKFIDLLDFLLEKSSIDYINLYTGYSDTIPYVPQPFAFAFRVLLTPTEAIFDAFGVLHAPLWVALLTTCFSWGIVIAGVRMVTKLIRGGFPA